MNNEDEELKKLQCIEALYSDNRIVSSAARDYYYTNYGNEPIDVERAGNRYDGSDGGETPLYAPLQCAILYCG